VYGLDEAVMPAVDSPGSPGIAPDGRHARTLVDLLGGLPFRRPSDVGHIS